MIVPRHHTNWADLVRHLTKLQGRPVSWVFSNTYFFDDDLGLPRDGDDEVVNIPQYLYMFKFIYRSARYNPLHHNMKSFNDPERVLTVHNHAPLKCIPEKKCQVENVNVTVAHLQHYHRDCSRRLKSVCKDQYKKHRVKDTSLFQGSSKIKDVVIGRIKNTLKHLGLI